MKPIIGIVGHPYVNKDNNLIFQTTNSIVKKILLCGGLPIIICPTQVEDFYNKKCNEINTLTFCEKKDLDNILSLCDAIIKPGASKIYTYERYIYSYAYDNNIPYLGICAGMQLMAQYDNDNINVKNSTNINHNSNREYVHKIKIFHNTLLYDILKQDEIYVNSLHNYHIATPGINKVNAYSFDGIIEGIENTDKTFHLGLQWHPEALDDLNSYRLFNTFIEKAISKKKIKKI